MYPFVIRRQGSLEPIDLRIELARFMKHDGGRAHETRRSREAGLPRPQALTCAQRRVCVQVYGIKYCKLQEEEKLSMSGRIRND